LGNSARNEDTLSILISLIGSISTLRNPILYYVLLFDTVKANSRIVEGPPKKSKNTLAVHGFPCSRKDKLVRANLILNPSISNKPEQLLMKMHMRKRLAYALIVIGLS